MGFLPLPRHCTSSRRHPGRKHGRAETAAPTSQTIIERLVSFVFARLLCFLPLRRINTPASAADREDDGEDGGRAPPWRLFPNTQAKPFSNVGKLLCLCVIITAAEWTGFYGNKPIIPPSAGERERERMKMRRSERRRQRRARRRKKRAKMRRSCWNQREQPQRVSATA